MEDGETERVCIRVQETTQTSRNKQTKAQEMQNSLVLTLLEIAWILT